MGHYFWQRLSLLIMACLLTAGGPSKIIGQNEMLAVKSNGTNVDANLRPYLDAFGLVMVGSEGACSATHLGNGFVLTAGHCFFDDTFVGTRVLQNRECGQMKIFWSYRGSPETGNPRPYVSLTSQCTKLIYAEQTQQRDFAVFRVDNPPKVQVGIAIESRRTQTGTKLTLFGFPEGRPLEWSQYCALLLSSTGGLSAIKGQSTFLYTCDTEPGNSGGAVLAISSTGQPRVVGVHAGSAPLGVDYNYATFLFDIRKVLKSKGFDLDRALASGGI